MRVKLDENLPASLTAPLVSLGHDVDTAIEEGLQGRDDPDVWDAAQATGRFLITQDLDFSDARRYAPGTHAGVLLLRLRNPSRSRLHARVESLFRDEPVDTWRSCFVVASDTKVRVRRPP